LLESALQVTILINNKSQCITKFTEDNNDITSASASIDDDNTSALVITMHTTNQHGGTKQSSDINVRIERNGVLQKVFSGSETSIRVPVVPGNYSITEDLPVGYQAIAQGQCSGNIAPGQTKYCTILNADSGQALRTVTSSSTFLQDSEATSDNNKGKPSESSLYNESISQIGSIASKRYSIGLPINGTTSSTLPAMLALGEQQQQQHDALIKMNDIRVSTNSSLLHGRFLGPISVACPR
jgi:hypothetical protein